MPNIDSILILFFLYSLKFFESYKMMEKVDFASIFAKDTWL